MADPQHITYTPRPDTSPEAELHALATVYRYVFDSQASKGGSNDLTNDPTPKKLKNGPRTTEQENT